MSVPNSAPSSEAFLRTKIHLAYAGRLGIEPALFRVLKAEGHGSSQVNDIKKARMKPSF